MQKRVHVALAVLLVVLISAVVWQVLRSQKREPVYQGKRLRVWLDEYSFRTLTGAIEARNTAEAAIQQIGTNAIPTLLNLLRKKDSPLVARLILLWGRYVTRTSYLPFWVAYPSWYQVHAAILNRQGSLGFEILRANGHPAVPALIRLYEQEISPSSQYYVGQALMAIGPDAMRRAIPSFVRGAASPKLLMRKNAVRALLQVHDDSSLVVSALAKSIVDTNVFIRTLTAMGLGEFGRKVPQSVPLVVPLLIKALSDPDGSVRGSAACSLKTLGAEAKGAVPALLDSLKDKDEYARGTAAEALLQIDPGAAAKAGVKWRL
ncbi:MAG: HEAT repeat domain-containing protein [Verrucomicrobia bacterium]|nr:HEAT repeat domain-containing protein [Verrucomicrobiota bacterium]